jgi:hypothetical protein
MLWCRRQLTSAGRQAHVCVGLIITRNELSMKCDPFLSVGTTLGVARNEHVRETAPSIPWDACADLGDVSSSSRNDSTLNCHSALYWITVVGGTYFVQTMRVLFIIPIILWLKSSSNLRCLCSLPYHLLYTSSFGSSAWNYFVIMFPINFLYQQWACWRTFPCVI